MKTCNPPERQDLLRDAVVEAGRQLLARLLVEERRRPAAFCRMSPETVEALQTLRDTCSSERAARSSR